MPPNIPIANDQLAAQLQALGEQIRDKRKALRLSATVTAEAAGVSRVTLYRIEKGEPTVAVGAWGSVMTALGMELHARLASDGHASTTQKADRVGWIPARVPLADYPQLRSLAWQVHGSDTLTPTEALDIYERNDRHIDIQAMSPNEHALLQALKLALTPGAGAGTGENHAV